MTKEKQELCKEIENVIVELQEKLVTARRDFIREALLIGDGLSQAKTMLLELSDIKEVEF